MFPVRFVKSVVNEFCREGGAILDPYCGRGTVPFAASVTGREALGVDINPVAWLYAQTKLDPEPSCERVVSRLEEIGDLTLTSDRRAKNDFQEWAWASDVLAFLNASRRLLDWKNSRLDRTLMAIISVYLHGKRHDALSNQMRQSKSMSPDYAVRWWRQRKLRPLKIDPVDFLRQRVIWRYRYGIPKGASARVVLGDAQNVVSRSRKQFSMLLTSPPYCGVTNYSYDNWIRLWLLGGKALPSGSTSHRYQNRDEYRQALRRSFAASAARLEDDAIVYVRTDARVLTRNITAQTMAETWPERRLVMRAEKVKRSQTQLFQDIGEIPGETDLIALRPRQWTPKGFSPIPRDWLNPHSVRPVANN